MKPILFELQLKESHLQHSLRALEDHRYRFPRSNVKFEFVCNGYFYETYVDNSGRLKLETILNDYDLEVSDLLRFRKVGDGTQWELHLIRRGELLPGSEFEVSTRGHEWRESKTLTNDEIYELLSDLAQYYDMIPEDSFQESDHIFPIVWKRTISGYPVWVFEVMKKDTLDSTLVKLKYARNTWNSDIMIVAKNLEDLQTLQKKIGESFQEIRRKTVIILSWDLFGLCESKEKYHFVDSHLYR